MLRQKHPDPIIPAEDHFDEYETTPDSVGVFCYEEDVAKACAKMRGASGPCGVDSDLLKGWLLRYGTRSDKLREEMALWACMLANASPAYAKYRAVNAARMLAADKQPGVRPLACGEVYMRLWARCTIAAECKELARDACGNTQLCGGLQAGIEGSCHAIRAIWPESGGWTFDRGTAAEPTNVFEQLLDGAERGLMLDETRGVQPEVEEEEEDDPGAAEFTEHSRYKSNTGFGAMLVDAANAFNVICRYLMLWNVKFRWHKGSRFAFNRYRHHNIVIIRRNPGQAPYKILSKEGVAQGCVLGMILYGIGLMPLAEQMKATIPEALQPWYADDAAAAGEAVHNARCMNFLVENGPRYGYFPEPEKSHYICKGEDEAVARAAFAEFGLTINYTRGHRYLGSYLGCGTLKRDYIEAKVSRWCAGVSTLAKLAVKYPQSAFAGYSFCLENEWLYVMRCTPDIAPYFGPLEQVIREEFIPALLDVGSDYITHEFREELALSVKQGGLGIRNPTTTADTSYNTSLYACQYLVETMVNDEKLDIVRHTAHMAEANASCRRQRFDREANFQDRRTRGKPSKQRLRRKACCGTGRFLNVIPSRLNGTVLSANEWRDNVRLRFNLVPLDLPQNCDGCGCRMTVEHAMQCKKGGLVHIRHDDLGKEFAYLAGCALSHTRVEREPLIHSSVGRRAREVAAEEGEADPTPTPQQQSTSDTDETRGDVGIHGFWERGRQAVFDFRVTDTDCRSYRHKDPKQVLTDQEKEKKDKYVDACHELRKDFTPMVYSVDGIVGREAKMAEKRLACYLSKKWHRPYSQVVHFVGVRMALALARSTSLLLRGSRDREPARPFIQSGSALHEPMTWQER